MSGPDHTSDVHPSTSAKQVGDDHEHTHEHTEHGHEHDDHEHASGLKGFVLSIVKPHSHDAADSIDSALESSKEGIRALKISLVALLLTALAQLVVVLVSGSVALLADTIHNFSDALTAVPLGIAFVLARRAPTRRYTYGFGRAEDLAGVFIVAMIALSALVAGFESARRLIDPQPITNTGIVLAAGVLGFIGNEAVAVYRIRIGRKIGSAALVADGLHARTDGFTSLAVAAGAIGVMAGFPLADPIVGLLITVAILSVLRSAARDIYRRLMDAVDPELVERSERVVSDVPGVIRVDGLRVRWLGHRLRAEVEVSVRDDLDVVEAHRVAVAAEHALIHAEPKIDAVTVHVGPEMSDGTDPHDELAHHRTPAPGAGPQIPA